MDAWISESCCACLVTCNVTTMYPLSDPETMQLFKECTNLWFQDDDGHLPQHLCIMCYKQCEIWKCFKTRCQENHRLMGYPEPSDDEVEATNIAPVEPMVKHEPEDGDMDYEAEYLEQSMRASYDPLGGGERPKKRKKRKDVSMSRRTYGGRSEDEDFKIVPTPKKVKPKVEKDLSVSGSVSSASHNLYMKTYRDFLNWKTAEGATEINEDLMLKYFTELSKILAPSTLTNKLSHLVRTIDDYHQVKIDGYHRVRKFCRDVRARNSIPQESYVD